MTSIARVTLTIAPDLGGMTHWWPRAPVRPQFMLLPVQLKIAPGGRWATPGADRSRMPSTR